MLLPQPRLDNLNLKRQIKLRQSPRKLTNQRLTCVRPNVITTILPLAMLILVVLTSKRNSLNSLVNSLTSQQLKSQVKVSRLQHLLLLQSRKRRLLTSVRMKMKMNNQVSRLQKEKRRQLLPQRILTTLARLFSNANSSRLLLVLPLSSSQVVLAVRAYPTWHPSLATSSRTT